MNRLAALISAMPASFSSLARRSWRVPNMRSERPAHLGQALLVDRLAGLGSEEVVAAAIGVEAGRQALLREHLKAGPKGRGGAFFLNQKCRVDGAGGIIHRHDQIKGW